MFRKPNSIGIFSICLVVSAIVATSGVQSNVNTERAAEKYKRSRSGYHDNSCGHNPSPMKLMELNEKCDIKKPHSTKGSSVLEAPLSIQTFGKTTGGWYNVGLNITWSATVSSPGYLFLLKRQILRPVGYPAEPCVLFSSQDSLTDGKMDFVYNGFCQKMFNFTDHAVIDVEFTAFSTKNQDHVTKSIVTVVQQKQPQQKQLRVSGKSSALWVTDIMVYPDSCNQSVRVEFMLAPTKFHFRKYHVFLSPYDERDREPRIYDEKYVMPNGTSRMGSTVFDFISREPYRILVKPKGDCLCNNEDKTRGCYDDLCQVSYSEVFNIKDWECIPEIATTTAVYTGDEGNKTLAVILGVVAGLLCAVTAIMILLKRKGCFHQLKFCLHRSRLRTSESTHRNRLQDCDNFIAMTTISESQTQQVLLVYSADHYKHNDTVLAFANLLTKSFQCEIHYVSENVDATWLLDEISKVQKVIIIESEGSYHKAMALERAEYYQDYFDSFTPVFQLLMDQEVIRNSNITLTLISVRFDYTKERYLLPLFNNTPRYCLMEDLNQLFVAISGFEAYSNYYSECLSVNSDIAPVECELRNAIVDMRDYVSQNPGWFHDIYREPVAINNAASGAVSNRSNRPVTPPVSFRCNPPPPGSAASIGAETANGFCRIQNQRFDDENESRQTSGSCGSLLL